MVLVNSRELAKHEMLSNKIMLINCINANHVIKGISDDGHCGQSTLYFEKKYRQTFMDENA
ncbi:MAG: hypothetical protein WAJ93_21515 [Candidatus Nitrosopolaris sp.]